MIEPAPANVTGNRRPDTRRYIARSLLCGAVLIGVLAFDHRPGLVILEAAAGYALLSVVAGVLLARARRIA